MDSGDPKEEPTVQREHLQKQPMDRTNLILYKSPNYHDQRALITQPTFGVLLSPIKTHLNTCKRCRRLSAEENPSTNYDIPSSYSLFALLFIPLLAWFYRTTRPPPPKLCGSPGGPPVTGHRITLRDGRHLAYNQYGVSKTTAEYKILLVHGFSSCRYDESIFHPELFEELKICMVTFDRPGYGESDPDPKRTVRSLALDMEELADKLNLGSKFYVIGHSMGQQGAWGSLKYIPHRLAGVALISPVVNYWWSSFPTNLTMTAYKLQPSHDQWAVGVSHYASWLVYWWNTQKWFPGSSAIAGKPNFSVPDLQVLVKRQSQGSMASFQKLKEYTSQQGLAESMVRDLIVGFGKWEFDPMELENPFPNNEGSVHLWHGDEDGIVPLSLQRYIAEKLPWIHYHELPGVGHLVPIYEGKKKAILKSLLIGNY